MSIMRYKSLGISVCTVQCVGDRTRSFFLTAPNAQNLVVTCLEVGYYFLLSIDPFLVRFKSYRRVVYGVL